MVNTSNIANRIYNSYLMEEVYLRNTPVAAAVTVYDASKQTRTDLDALRISVDEYKDGLPGNVTLYAAANRFVGIIEIEYVFEQVGNDSLSDITLLGAKTSAGSSLSAQSSIMNTAMQNAIGSGALNSIGFLGNKESVPGSLGDFANKASAVIGSGRLLEKAAGTGDITTTIGTTTTGLLATPGKTIAGAIGNTAMNSYTLLGVVYAAADSLSGQLSGFISAAQNVIGTANLKASGFLGTTPAVPRSFGDFANKTITVIGNGALLEKAAGTGDITTTIGTTTTGLLATPGKTIAGAIGNTAMNSYTLLGVVYAAADSLSGQLSNFITAVQTMMGSTRIAPTTPFTLKTCTLSKKIYSLGDPIYTTSNDITKTIFNMEACAKWADTNLDHIITPTGLVADCILVDSSLALGKCMHYLHPNP